MSLKAQAFQQACRNRYLLSNAPPAFPTSTARLLQRSYAAQSSLGGSNSSGGHRHAQRKAITVTSDDGRLQWSELSTREKAARSTQQSVNFVIVAAGAAGTVTYHRGNFENFY
jgi:mitochondrial import inner membrane translocase subunit TIM21